MRCLALVVLTALTALPAGTVFAGPTPVKVKKPASADDQALAKALVGRMRDGRFVGIDERSPVNGRAFLHLAATSDDPAIVAAALRGLSYTWSRTARRGSKRPAVNADYIAVVRTRLGEKDGRIRGEALRASRLPIGGEKPDMPTVDAVLALLASANEADQVAALEAVYNIRAFSSPRRTPGDLKAKVIKAVLPLLDSKSHAVAAGAFYAFAQSAYAGMPEAATLAARAKRSAKHPEPAVRAEALRLTSALASKTDDELTERLLSALGDPSPYVRASAAELLAERKYVPAVHPLMKLIEDKEKATRKITGFRDLAGKPGTRRFRPETGGRVDEVALRAIDELTDSIDPKLKCTPRGRDQKQARREAVERAQTWYEANKDKIPVAKAGVAPVAPAAPEKAVAPAKGK